MYQTPTPPAESTTWMHKAMAMSIMLVASAGFVVTVLWPVVAVFV